MPVSQVAEDRIMSALSRRAPGMPVILHYHSLLTLSREEDPHNLAVPVARFRRQIESLARRNYEFLTVAEFAGRIRDGEPPKGICALTFDDGTADNAEHLPELLDEFDAQATVYVCPGLLGARHPDFAPSANVRFMTADELTGLAGCGRVEIGSHTNHHTPLHDADAETALREMKSSKAAIEALIDRPVSSFAYPLCGYSAECPEAAHRAGYTSAVTCVFRGSWDPYALQRESVTSLDGRVAFALKSRSLWTAIHHSVVGRVGRAVRWGLRPGSDDDVHPSARLPRQR